MSQETFQVMIREVAKARLGKKGSPSKLLIPDQILLTLQYWREYRTFFHLAQDWEIHEATAWRTVKRIEDILVKSEKFRLPSKRKLQQKETEIEIIVVDVGETEVERPKKNRNSIIVGKNAATLSRE